MAELVAVVSKTSIAAGIAFISAALAPFNLVFGCLQNVEQSVLRGHSADMARTAGHIVEENYLRAIGRTVKAAVEVRLLWHQKWVWIVMTDKTQARPSSYDLTGP